MHRVYISMYIRRGIVEGTAVFDSEHKAELHMLEAAKQFVPYWFSDSYIVNASDLMLYQEGRDAPEDEFFVMESKYEPRVKKKGFFIKFFKEEVS